MDQKTKKTVTVFLVALIVLLLFLLYFQSETFTSVITEKSEAPVFFPSYTTIIENEPVSDKKMLLGMWRATEEEILGSEIITPIETILTFNEDGTYTLIEETYVQEGYYELDSETETITFSESEEAFNEEGIFLIGTAFVDKDSLIISYPRYPKILRYKRLK